MENINIPSITEENILAQNQLTSMLSKKMPEIIIGNYSISLLEVHWLAISLKNSFHSHRFFEIHIPYRGQGKIFTKNKQAFYKPGFFTITQPEQAHAWECIAPPLHMQVWWLSIRQLKKISKEQPRDPLDNIIENLISADNLTYPLHPFFFNAFDLMLKEVAEPQAGSEIILKSLFKQMIILLCRSVKPMVVAQRSTRTNRINKLDNRILLSRVDEFIQSNLKHEITLDEIAQFLDMSPRTLTRRYQKSNAQTIWQTITQMRMTKAKVLLQDSGLSIYEIAERCGIHNKHYFSAKFNKHFGFSPSAFRETIKLRKDND